MQIGRVITLEPGEELDDPAVRKEIQHSDIVIRLVKGSVHKYDPMRIDLLQSTYTQNGKYMLDRRSSPR